MEAVAPAKHRKAKAGGFAKRQLSDSTYSVKASLHRPRLYPESSLLPLPVLFHCRTSLRTVFLNDS